MRKNNIPGKISCILLLLVVLILEGCIPAAFVAGTATGTIIYDHRSAKTIVEDRTITFNIQQAFDKDEELRRLAHVSVTTFNNIVLLVGQAPEERLRQRAENIAKSDPKVKMVYNEIAIDKAISDMRCANDTWLTTKVKTVLLTTSKLNSTTLKIVTENGVVYLLGLTTRLQAKIAAEATRTVSGVKKVVKLFEYIE